MSSVHDHPAVRCAKHLIGHERGDLRRALAQLSKPNPDYIDAIANLCCVISDASDAIDACAYLISEREQFDGKAGDDDGQE